MPSHKSLYPRYTKRFQCIGPRCPQTCCGGWDVRVDEKALQKYKTDPRLIPLLKDNLREEYDRLSGELKKVTIKEDPTTGLCSLLDDEGLCSIQIAQGESALCNTCAIYPRQAAKIKDDLIVSMTDSCPEVARMLVNDPKAMELDLGQLRMPPQMQYRNLSENELVEQRFPLLQGLFTILRHRDISLEMRLLICGLLIQRAQKLEHEDDSEMTHGQLVELFFKLVGQNYFEPQIQPLREKSDGTLGLIILRVIRKRVAATPGKSRSPFTLELINTLKGLEAYQNTSVTELHLDNLERARTTYYTPWLEQTPHAMENIIANWVLNTSPELLTTPDITEPWFRLVIRYLALRSIICGTALHQQALTEEDAIRTLYCFSRGIIHSGIPSTIETEMGVRGLNSIEALTWSLRP